MKKWIIIGALVVALVGMGISFKGIYNKLVVNDEAVAEAWSQVENQYQRRADLIPNLVNVVKGYAQHEKLTLQSVIEARSKATQVKVNVEDMSKEALQKYEAAQSDLSRVLSRLMALTESYPDLKANQNFMQLQSQLEGTENRIATERKRFNILVRDFNTYRRTFPRFIVASMAGFEAKEYFEAADKAGNTSSGGGEMMIMF